ncbi:MAG: phospholipase D-like domain-containing protein [Flavobacteriaceae bacterium]
MSDGLAQPGRNCCARAVADQGRILIDGANYFGALEEALRLARRSILIIGWDFDGGIRLRRDVGEDESPPLGVLLRQLVEERDELTVHILIWSISVLHAPGSSQELIFGADWQDHPRIHIRLATDHPVYAAHHQKIVAIDDSLAFIGGIDLTVDRWDTQEHQPEAPQRATPAGQPYPPVHDIQIAVSGGPAGILAAVARDRWRGATQEELAPSGTLGAWPRGWSADFRNIPVSVARTLPGIGRREPVHEGARQLLDMLEAARDTIYIEAQYMTAFSIGRMLARRLCEEDGPEVVIVMSYEAHGFMERWIMQTNRDRLIRYLRGKDRFGRLRVLYPCVPSDKGSTGVFVHSKLVIADDRYLRIGSSNLNNRSIGLDSECDILIEAADAESRAAITSVRDRLLAEHLGRQPHEISSCVAEGRSLIAALEALNDGERSLKPFDALSDRGPARPMPGTWFLDPKRPLGLISYLLPYRHKRAKVRSR